MRTINSTIAGSAVLAVSVAGAITAAGSAVADQGCSPAGQTGMTAKVVVTSASTVTNDVDATGCDIGIYVGVGGSGAVIDGATVSGANDHGILVQDVDGVVIRNSTITHNGVARHDAVIGGKLSEDKALTLLGTHEVVVENNRVVGNVGDGGISINDDGPGPSEAVLHGGTLRAASDNVVRANEVSGNLFGCAIVLSAFHPGKGVNHNVVADNLVAGTKFSAVTGSVVVAADTPHSAAIGNLVLRNTVTFSLIPGIIVHSNAPGDLVSGTKIIHNTLVSDNWAPGADSVPGTRVGIAVASESAAASDPSVITDTQVVRNSITDEDYGIWLHHANRTRLVQNDFTNVATPVVWDK